MKRWKRIVLASTLAALLALAVAVVPTVWGTPWSIEHFYTRVFVEFMLQHPQLLTSMQLFEPLGLHFHNDELDDFSVDGSLRDVAMIERNLELLHRYDRAALADTLSYDVLEWFLLDLHEGGRFTFHNYPVNQLSGIQGSLPDFMINTHRVDDRRGARNYLARLRAFGPAFDQVIDSLEHRERLGVVPPRFVLAHVLSEMRELIAPPTEESVLYRHLAERLATIEDLDDAERTAILEEAAGVIAEVVVPAYRRLIDRCVALAAVATSDHGAWKLPDGDAYYAHRLRSYTTTDMSAEEIHAIGLAEVARIQAEMRAILAGEGLDNDGLGATMAALNRDPRFLYPDDEAGHRRVLDDYTAIIEEMEGGLDELFLDRPQAAVVVRPVPAFRADTAPVAYYDPPPMDGSRPGTFYVNLAQIEDSPRFGMRTLAYHEAVPGHHLQTALAREMRDVPLFRRVVPFAAYSEGWALYAEQLAAEVGYQEDPYDRLGYLVAQAMRAVRLVVDTGIHHQRWTREEAIDYMTANTGMPRGEVVTEVERYIVDPGQATAYMVGYLELLRLREEARAALGADFDLRDFHRVVLADGALPLTLLRQQVERWYGRATSDG